MAKTVGAKPKPPPPRLTPATSSAVEQTFPNADEFQRNPFPKFPPPPLPPLTIWDNIVKQQSLYVRWMSGNLLCTCDIAVDTRIRHVNAIASRLAGRAVAICATESASGPFSSDMLMLHLMSPGLAERTAWVVAVANT